MTLVVASSSVPVTRQPGATGSRPSTSWWRRTPTAASAPADLPVLGEVAYAAGHLDVSHRGVGARPRRVYSGR